MAGVSWEYIACGHGRETLLLLPGGLRLAETAFAYVALFEDTYRLIVPTYPPLDTMDEITDGIAAILDAERETAVIILGQSYGGLVAQAFLRRFPARVKKLVLSSTGPLAEWSRPKKIALALSHLLLRLPEKVQLALYKRALRPVLSVPEAERAFWHAYLDELFGERLTKGDVKSQFDTLRHGVAEYAYNEGEQSSWEGVVFIIDADNDPGGSEADLRRMQAIYPQAEVCLIPGAGHTAAMAEPVLYETAVSTFLNR